MLRREKSLDGRRKKALFSTFLVSEIRTMVLGTVSIPMLLSSRDEAQLTLCTACHAPSIASQCPF